jgi:hypothetical protein
MTRPAALVLDVAGDPRVLLGHPLRRVEQEHRHVTALHGPERPNDAQPLGALAVDAPAATEAGGVDENVLGVRRGKARCRPRPASCRRVLSTIIRSSPNRRFVIVDLPTFGRPTRATRVTPGSLGGRGRNPAAVSSTMASTSVRRMPRPCAAETGHDRSRRRARRSRRGQRSAATARRPCSPRRSKASRERRSRSATSTSAGTRPSRASTTNTTTSASSTASIACRRI